MRTRVTARWTRRRVGSVATALPDSWEALAFRAPALHLASWNFTGGASG